MGVDKVLAAKREETLRFLAKHGARNVRVFGSRAKDKAGPESDSRFTGAHGARPYSVLSGWSRC